MIDSQALLDDLKLEVTKLEDDLRARCDADTTVDAPLKERYDAARTRKRTALTYKAWREEELTNVAVAWVLGCVFVRFLEDNGLVETLHLAGPDAGSVGRARDQHELFFREHPQLTEREYLEHVFNATAALPGMKDLFDRRHNPLWLVGPTGDAATALVNFWRRASPETGRPLHDFSDPEWGTRFLGDLYQDLSEAARKRYALLQTPVFVEQFILDRTLTPAIETFGFRVVRMMDPTCGSGHFLLGGFGRLFRLWQEAEPAESPVVLAQRALDQVYGVDLNPNVVAIARFRLLLVALRATRTTRLRHAFDFRINVVTGDALLHGRRFVFEESDTGAQRTFDTEELFRDELKHLYDVEDGEALHRVLGQQYHAVVGNPPYITVKDRALSELYRARYPSSHRQYSLSVPFMERFFDLAVTGDGSPHRQAGFIGQITANSFMKREFGRKLIEQYLPRWDLTHIIDTSGAYIPGHGTPTVILFGRNRPPQNDTIRTVLGIRGEPVTPGDPAKGLVWQAILNQVDRRGSASSWVTAADSARASFRRHPWSIGGGGAAELKEELDQVAASPLSGIAVEIGSAATTGEDDAFTVGDAETARRLGLERSIELVDGSVVRNWQIGRSGSAVWVYDERYSVLPLDRMSRTHRFLWPTRQSLKDRKKFSVPVEMRGLKWYEWRELYLTKLETPLALTYGEIATHNNFAFGTRGQIFNKTAPVIKLGNGAREADYIKILGVLNSSLGCFWMKQTCFPKGGSGIGRGIQHEPWESRHAFNSTQIGNFPIPAFQPLALTRTIVEAIDTLEKGSPSAILANWKGTGRGELSSQLATAKEVAVRTRRKLIAWQEELDWQIYQAFGLIEPADAVANPEEEAQVPSEGLELGQRAFEIVLARRMVAGEVQTTWFDRHGSTPTTEVPIHWPRAYRELVERRIRRIYEDANIRLIEQPECKRRWNTQSWDELFLKAAREWLLARLEGYFFEGARVTELKDGFSPEAAGFTAAPGPKLVTTNQLAGIAQTDRAFLAVAEELMASPGFSVPKLVRELVDGESVPFLPVQRYKPAGLLKRRDWEHVWALQRREDAIDAEVGVEVTDLTDNQRAERKSVATARKKAEIGEIPVPPKYGSGDFRKSEWWGLRGKLDTPKERWISYPGAERAEDPSPVIAWAGWDHAQQARALAEYYVDARDNFGFSVEKRTLLLAGLLDLEPWLIQWHSALNPLLGDSPANAIRGFIDAECHTLGITRQDLEVARMGATPAGS